MIVDATSLAVLPVCDKVLQAVAGEIVGEVEVGPLAWSNELVLHVIELKTNGPASSLAGLAEAFAGDVRRINALLAPLGGVLMPSAMHPSMDPLAETRLWPHDNSPIYDTYNRIFGCLGHGWANLQSVHLNLPFAGDEEFARLHAAIRLVLPLLPALAASSPLLGNRQTGFVDNRLEVYRLNQQRIPSITGRVIPEPAYSRSAYEEMILQPIYRDIAPLDPEGILQYEWLNSRGAIARFDRDTIEIRLLDIQECPRADLAVLELIDALLKALVAETWETLAAQQFWPLETLEPFLLDAIRDGERAVIDNPRYLAAFGSSREVCTLGVLWQDLAERLQPSQALATGEALAVILEEGPLSRRLLCTLGSDPSPAVIRETYRALCACLAEGRSYRAS
jgi:gamma-glutamyl:cysteine ligase YbdK (ATP-grasp superfamily)